MMSRCFLFPPPGYEARPRSEQQHKDLLKKEKHKEKKHREEKERGKRDTKEKDRDRRKDKHNKKHKREKRVERRKNEDRDKDKKQSLGQESQKDYKHGNRKPEKSGQNEAVKDIKSTDELVTRTFCQEGSKEKERNSVGRMVKKSVEATQDNYGNLQKSGIARANKKGMCRGVDSKAKIKNGKSLQVGSAEMNSRRKHSCNGVGVRQDNSNAQKNCVHTANPVVSDSRRVENGKVSPSSITSQKVEEMEPDPDISVHSAKVENNRVDMKGGMMGKENQTASNCFVKMNHQFVRNTDGEVEGKAKTNNCNAVKGQDRDMIVKNRKTDYKSKEKEMEKKGILNEHKHEDHGGRKDKVDDLMRLGFLNEQKFTSDSTKKRKDFDASSSPHEHSMRMTKLQRVSPTKDEEICRHSERITTYSSIELLSTNICKIDRHKPEVYNNAITGSHCSEEEIASVSSSGHRNNKDHLKQPHPDAKYLSQLYSIPPAQDFSDYIDQDWLFSQHRDELKTVAFEAVESNQVFSDAQLIDTADVIALPYVVPL